MPVRDTTSNSEGALVRPVSDVRAVLKERIALGQQILEKPIRDEESLKLVRDEANIWSNYNAQYLRSVCTNEDLLRRSRPRPRVRRIGPTFRLNVRDSQAFVEDRIQKLIQIEDILEMYPVSVDDATRGTLKEAPGQSASRRVFLVHGHDEGAKQSVARLLERLQLEPIILHEQPDRGRTVIEKFED